MNALWFICGGILFMFFIIFAILPILLYFLMWYFLFLLALGFVVGFCKGAYTAFIKLCEDGEGIPIEDEDDPFTKILFDNGYKA